MRHSKPLPRVKAWRAGYSRTAQTAASPWFEVAEKKHEFFHNSVDSNQRAVLLCGHGYYFGFRILSISGLNVKTCLNCSLIEFSVRQKLMNAIVYLISWCKEGIMMKTRSVNRLGSSLAIAAGVCAMLLSSSAIAASINIDNSVSSGPRDGTVDPGDPGGLFAQTQAFNVPAGSDRMLVVTVSGEISGINSFPPPLGGVSWGSQAMTMAVGATEGSSFKQHASVWYLLNPDVGAGTITAVRDSGSGAPGWAFGALALSNVQQVAPTILGSDTGAPVSTDLTTIVNNSLVVEAMARNSNGTGNPEQGQTLFVDEQSFGDGAGAFGSYEVIPAAGLTTRSWNPAGSGRTALAAVAFAPVPEPSTLLLGLGAICLAGLRRRGFGTAQ